MDDLDRLIRESEWLAETEAKDALQALRKNLPRTKYIEVCFSKNDKILFFIFSFLTNGGIRGGREVSTHLKNPENKNFGRTKWKEEKSCFLVIPYNLGRR